VDDIALFWLLILVTAMSLLLVLASTAALGRLVADLEYQYAAGLNGVRRIQSWVNIRTHANRVILGLTFLVTGILSFTDAPILWRTWIGRVLFVVVLACYTVSSIMDWLAERKQVRLLLREQTVRGT
jgi:hypothetical protein